MSIIVLWKKIENEILSGSVESLRRKRQCVRAARFIFADRLRLVLKSSQWMIRRPATFLYQPMPASEFSPESSARSSPLMQEVQEASRERGDALSSRRRILDAAEHAYAMSGISEFTLRALTDQAGVNLAAINYHFRSKAALIEAMLLRVLRPLAAEQLDLLSRIEHQYGDGLCPTHVIAAILLPLMREVRRRESNRWRFIARVSTDSHALVRPVLENAFGSTCRSFERAFANSAAHLTEEDAIWRSRLFCNALPGSLQTYALGAMCAQMLALPGTTAHDVLMQFGILAETAMTGLPDPIHVARQVSALLVSLVDSAIVHELAQDLPLSSASLTAAGTLALGFKAGPSSTDPPR